MKSLSDYYDLVSVLLPSLVTAGAVAIGGSQVGTFVMYRRESLMALALPQVVAIGVALALHEEWPTLAPAIVAAALAVVALAWSKRHGANYWLLPSLYIGGLSLSFLLIANAGQHVEEMQHRFTGMDVAVSTETAWMVVPCVLSVGLLTSVLWRRWLALIQAPAAAELAGLRPARWDALFLSLLGAVLLFGTAALGAVMVLTMLFLPAATVMPWTRRIPASLFAAAIVALAFLIVGFVLSVEMDWPLSHSVGGAGFAALAISQIVCRVMPRRAAW